MYSFSYSFRYVLSGDTDTAPWAAQQDCVISPSYMASWMAQQVKGPNAAQETRVQPLGREEPLEKEMGTIPAFLPGPPIDGGAWWATVHGGLKSQT